jgi:nucleotide-binding universal stress UspA family protein
MVFENIIVPIDGSDSSRIAADYGFWLASSLKARLTAQSVIDPRATDLLLAPEFAEETGLKFPIDASEKLLRAQKRISLLTLDLFKKQSVEHSLSDVQTCLDLGPVANSILKRSSKHDLTIVGHHGRSQQSEIEQATGATARRVATDSTRSVLIAFQPIQELGHILLAYDGSATADSALVMAERLAVALRKDLKVVHVAPTKQQFPKAKVLMQKAATHLNKAATAYSSAFDNGKQFLDKVTFIVREGHPAETLIEFSRVTNGLLVIGSNGSRPRSHKDFLGKTSAYVIRKMETSVLVYRPE